MDTIVSLEDFESAKAKIDTIMSQMDSFLKAAKNASNAVTNSVGGTSTKVGSVIQEKIVDVNEGIFDKAKNSLSNMVDNVSTINRTYRAEEEDILDSIANYTV